MKYTLIDGEIHLHQREGDTYWPLSLEEAQHVVNVMNGLFASSKTLALMEEALRERPDVTMTGTYQALLADVGAVPTDMLPRALALLNETVED